MEQDDAGTLHQQQYFVAVVVVVLAVCVTATRTCVDVQKMGEFRFWRGVHAAIPLVGWPWKICCPTAAGALRSVLLTYVNWCTRLDRGALALKTFAMTSICLAKQISRVSSICSCPCLPLFHFFFLHCCEQASYITTMHGSLCSGLALYICLPAGRCRVAFTQNNSLKRSLVVLTISGGPGLHGKLEISGRTR